MKIWKWVKRWWYVPLFAVGVLFAWILVQRWFPKRKPTPPPLDRIRKEIQAIEAGAKVAKLEAELGHEQAIQHVEDQYAKELKALTEERRAQADKLRADPEALARFVVRGEV